METTRLKMIQTENFKIENLNPQLASIYPKNSDVPYTGFDKNHLILDFGEKVKGDLTVCIFDYIFNDNQYKIKSTGSSCGCTNPTFISTDEGNQQVKISFDTNKVANKVSKVFTLYLENGNLIKFNLIMNM